LIDLTETLKGLRVSQSGGPLDICVRTLSEIVEDLGAWTDWDEFSAEFWARLLVDRDVIALINMYNPIIFVVGDRAVPPPPDFTVFRVPGFDTECLAADRRVLVEKFGDKAAEQEICAELFALSDLWAVSV
jgi:hypothetical protein